MNENNELNNHPVSIHDFYEFLGRYHEIEFDYLGFKYVIEIGGTKDADSLTLWKYPLNEKPLQGVCILDYSVSDWKNEELRNKAIDEFLNIKIFDGKCYWDISPEIESVVVY